MVKIMSRDAEYSALQADCVKAAEPPNGPARAAFWTRTTQTFEAPPTLAEQVMPAGI